MELKEGDIVVLKSLGPTMTLDSIENGEVRCVWFDNCNRLCTAYFKATSLDGIVSVS